MPTNHTNHTNLKEIESLNRFSQIRVIRVIRRHSALFLCLSVYSVDQNQGFLPELVTCRKKRSSVVCG